MGVDKRRSETGQKVQAWYRSKRWQRMRERQLRKQPYCECPHHKGKHEPANVVDHKTPHKGNERLFWDATNLQSLAKQCHDKYKQSQERGGAGFLQGCDSRGWPLSEEHEWHEGRRTAKG